MCCCRVPRYASSLAQAAWGWGQGSYKGTLPTQEDVRSPWGCDPSSTPTPSTPGTHTDTRFDVSPPGRCPPHLPGWPGRDGPGRAPPPALPPRRFRANFQRAGRRRRPVPGSGWAGGTASARPALPKGRSDTHPLPRVLRGRGRGSTTAPPNPPALPPG